MLLTITYTGRDTPELGFLLHKNPARVQSFDLSRGRALVFYPEVSDSRTTVALLLDIDPIALVRGRGAGLFDYVNDRPYVASSFMSTALKRVFSTAMTGRSDGHQELADSALDLTATVTMLPCRAGVEWLERIFTPLGYEVTWESFVLDEAHPEWGVSDLVNLTIHGRVRLKELLDHLYVLIPVFDRQKHYWVGKDEVDKLLRVGGDWLAAHPERAFITRSYLTRRRALVDEAFERLAAAGAQDGEITPDEDDTPSEPVSPTPNLNTQRLNAVLAELKRRGARRVIDLGCGEGNLLRLLMPDQQFTTITGMDVSHVALRRAAARLNLDEAGDAKRERVSVFQGSLMYADERLAGYDAAAVVEIIEHLDPGRLDTFARVVFGKAQPRIIILTTPNAEYNTKYDLADRRHADHRFEWSRPEFREWCDQTAREFGYQVEFSDIGDHDPELGSPTQMGVFTR